MGAGSLRNPCNKLEYCSGKIEIWNYRKRELQKAKIREQHIAEMLESKSD